MAKGIVLLLKILAVLWLVAIVVLAASGETAMAATIFKAPFVGLWTVGTAIAQFAKQLIG